MKRSLHAALFLWTATGLGAVVCVVGVLLYLLLGSVLVDQFDRSLLDKVLPLAAGVEQNPEAITLEFDDVDMREFERDERPSYFQLWLEDGREIYRSTSLGDARLDRAMVSPDAPAYWWTTLPDGRPGRAIGITYTPREEDQEEKEQLARETGVPFMGSGRRVTLVLARDTSGIEGPQTRMGAILGGVGLLAIAVLLGVLWAVITGSLRPLNRVAAQIGGLGADDLSSRLDPEGVPREIRPLIDRLNELLGRLGAAFQRERDLTADVAHELRTPVAGIRSSIEVALSRPRKAAAYQEILRDCLEITVRMQAMVENLLSLSRLESGEVQLEARPVAPGEALRSTWSLFEEAARARRLRVDWALGPDVLVTTDPPLLDAVLRNLLENAVEYADEGGRVKIGTLSDSRGVEILVSNTGSRLPASEVPHVFDRFWRGDVSRTNASTHCGVGMVVVKKITALLGADISVRSERGGEFEVKLSLPRNMAPA